MCRTSLCVLILVFFLSGIIAAQETRTIRVGVAVMQNDAGRSVPGTLERDRLVRALNRLKPDKKSGIVVRAVPLEGSRPSEVKSELEAAGCDYVVFTTLTELRGSRDPYQHKPGTFETNPGAPLGGQKPESEFRATVEFRLSRTGSASEIAGAPYSTQQAMPEADVVAQVMDRIANNVRAEITKDAPPR